MKILIAILGIIIGGYMLIDGVYVVVNGKYIGPEKPGIWSNIFTNLGMNIFKLGPLFIGYGILWLIWVYSLCTNQSWSYMLGIILSILSLWYLPIGTLFSLIILLVLIFYKSKLGL